MTIQLDQSQRKVAAFTGAAYGLMFALAIGGGVALASVLPLATNPSGIVSVLSSNEQWVRIGMFAFAVIFLLDISVSWGLYVVFSVVDKMRALHAAAFRLIYSAVLAVAVGSLFVGVQLAESGEFPPALVAAFVVGFQSIWAVGLTAFGLHLVILGWLIITSGFAHKILGWALGAAGTAYVADGLLQLLLTEYQSVAGFMAVLVGVLSIASELWLTVWLVAKGASRRSNAL
ncbi:DUF4386-like protein [Pontimonas salivibrio]|uniref:DUF4386-like protein n=1 Tax=Pontimonas salivibrio TaxID=1159327 RepID=A0A2L2BPV9_9MICO|nr:DUF4386 domain-containing protein [Pontimonas salivibrio]AVG23699.1 DUF4386-like protein [Pontimonas salivibrio]